MGLWQVSVHSLWAPAPSSLVTEGIISSWPHQPAQQLTLLAEIAPKPMETRALQGEHLVWPLGLLALLNLEHGVGISAGPQHVAQVPWHQGASPSCAWGGVGPALMLISVCQTASPRSSIWPRSWSSTWAQSPLSAAWPRATHCPPVTAWSCARLTALCSRYCHALAPPTSPFCWLPQKPPSPQWAAGQLQAGGGSQGAHGTLCGCSSSKPSSSQGRSPASFRCDA